MNRRNFTIKSILALTGSYLIPTSYLFSKNSFKLIEIGLPLEHIRHGIFNLNNFISIPQLNIQIKRDIFYNNGINKCLQNNDKQLITIEHNNKTFSFLNDEKEISKGNLRVHNLPVNSIIKDQKVDMKNALIIKLSGNIYINGINLVSNKGAIINSPINISGIGKILIIEML